jgi:23S rRNA pseudouridine1911/1915/1917 synthase
MMITRQTDSADYSPAIHLIPVEWAGLRLDAVLARLLPEHSRSRLQVWIKEGRVTIGGEVVDAKKKVLGGESVAVLAGVAGRAGDSVQPEAIDLNIVFEDEHILVVDKPAGLVVHPGSGNWSGTMMNALLHHAGCLARVPRAGIVHRLDKDTSGLLVVAKTPAAQTDLVRQLQARTVKRNYLALVHGMVSVDGLVDAPIGRHPVHRTRMAVVSGGSAAREARTHFSARQRFRYATLIECRLETGRTHQIRVHMASVGHPLVGDPVYGKRKSADARLEAFPRQALHAWRLALIHPLTHTEIAWESPLPDDFSTLLDSLQHG